MLTFTYVSLRAVHFAGLMLAFGCTLYGAWWATPQIRRLLMRHLSFLLKMALLVNALSATLLLMVQGGMMGSGWQDVVSPEIWLAVLSTHFGSIWLWQILFAWVGLLAAWLNPRRLISFLLLLCAIQLILLANTGHAAMREGISGNLQRLNHALHLLCASAWVGGLLPFLYCLRLATGRWQRAAIGTMMRFSRYGHLAVAGVIATGVVNALLIQGTLLPVSRWGEALLIKCALVAIMVLIALANRYVLVPEMAKNKQRVQQLFIRTTLAEIGLGALVLVAVSVLATWEPF